jgi:predicted small secreted protein
LDQAGLHPQTLLVFVMRGFFVMSKLWRCLLVLGLVMSLAACNTMQGMGKDIKKAGEKIEETAKG